jgi:hypothetical protein
MLQQTKERQNFNIQRIGFIRHRNATCLMVNYSPVNMFVMGSCRVAWHSRMLQQTKERQNFNTQRIGFIRHRNATYLMVKYSPANMYVTGSCRVQVPNLGTNPSGSLLTLKTTGRALHHMYLNADQSVCDSMYSASDPLIHLCYFSSSLCGAVWQPWHCLILFVCCSRCSCRIQVKLFVPYCL